MKEDDDIIKKAEEELEYLTGDAEIRRLAELRQKAFREERDAILNGRSEGRAIGLAEGIAKGFKEGEAKGFKEGETKGLKEGKLKERKNIAKSLLAKHIDINIISEVTNLSIDDINNL